MVTDELLKTLQEKHKDVSDVILFGIEAQVCILQTASDLRKLGYEVHIPMDGVSSQRQFDRVGGFRRLEQLGACLSTSESLLFQLLGSAKAPNFKAISKLVKEQERPETGSFF
jgi:hypothetical protein